MLFVKCKSLFWLTLFCFQPSDGVIDDVTITSDTAESDSKTVAPDESNSRNNIDADASRIAEDGLTRGAVRPIKAVDDNVQPSGSEALFAVSAAPGSGSPLTVAPPGASAFRAASYSTAVDVAAASFEPERGETVAVERPPPAAATATGHNLDTSHKSPTQQIILNTVRNVDIFINIAILVIAIDNCFYSLFWPLKLKVKFVYILKF